jgi:hypothetical protein
MPVLRGTQPSAAKQAVGKGGFEKSSSPQRLKPDSLHSSYVRPEGRTLQTACKAEFIRQQLCTA